ncbi:septum formation protein Maf [Candidatus Pelagibacter sp. IMCC9063]|nr:septum formation protein Maf [Candidatus Pelagibacter sp. IMCC9063]
MVEITKGLILASASPRRLELLKKINIIPERVEPAEIDETPKKKKNQLNIAKDLQKKKES